MPRTGSQGVKRTAADRVIPAAGVILVAVLVILAVTRVLGGADREVDASLGEVGDSFGTTVPGEDAPFEMAGSGLNGSTTLPEGFFDEDALATSTTMVPTTTAVPLDAPSGDAICQAALTLGELTRRVTELSDDPDLVRTYGVQRIRAAAGHFAAAGGVFVEMAAMLERRADQIELAVDNASMRDLYMPIVDLSDPAIPPILGPLEVHVAERCPSLSMV